MTVSPVLAVAAGSALGGAARYGISIAIASRVGSTPVATLVINVLGSFLLGVIVRASGETGPALRLLLTVGFCGGFTTFSTFSLENVRLLQAGAPLRALGYATLSVVLSVGALWVGLTGPHPHRLPGGS